MPAKTAPQVLTVPIGKVRPSEGQPRQRFDEAELDALADSIRQHGILTPLTVKPNGTGYLIVAGERRYRAAQKAGVKTLPVLVRDTDDAYALGTVENVVRADLDAVEEGHAYRALIDKHGTAEAVAALVSRPVERVNDRLALTELPEVTQALVIEGRMPLSVARTHVVVARVSEPVAALIGRLVTDGVIEPGSTWDQAFDKAERHALLDPCKTCKGEGNVEDKQHGYYVNCSACKGSGSKLKKTADPFLIGGNTTLDGEALHIIGESAPKEKRGPLYEAWERANKAQKQLLDGDRYGYHPWPRLMADEAVEDAARSYGCLIEVAREKYLTDAAFAAEYATLTLTAQAEAWERQATKASKKEKGGKGGTTAAASDGPDAAAKKRKAKQAESDRAAAEAARARNVDLGFALAKWQVRSKADTLAGVKATLIDLLVARGWASEAWEQVAQADRLVQDGHPVQHYKDGRWKKVEYPRDGDDLAKRRDAITAAINRAKTVEEALSAFYRPLIAARFVDTTGLPGADSNRVGVPSPMKRAAAVPFVEKALPASVRDHVAANPTRKEVDLDQDDDLDLDDE